MSEKVITALNQTLSNVVELYSRAHGMHWNLEGMFFPLYHEFFGNIYTEVYASIDPLAEEIRTLGGYAVYGTSAWSQMNMLPESKQLKGNDIKEMLKELDMCNALVIKSLKSTFALSEAEQMHGLSDFLAGRIDAHYKHDWMLKASLK
jgi:starvation-inducible DNA-binding protein